MSSKPYSLWVLALFAVMPAPTVASAQSFEGQGFDCKFQTGVSNLEALRVWYGGMRQKNPKVPQFEDDARLFVLAGMNSGQRVSFHVSDEWPDQFQAQYYDLSKGRTPLSLLTVDGTDEADGSYRAEIVHLPSDAKTGETIQPIRRISGRCTTTLEVTYEAFRS